MYFGWMWAFKFLERESQKMLSQVCPRFKLIFVLLCKIATFIWTIFISKAQGVKFPFFPFSFFISSSFSFVLFFTENQIFLVFVHGLWKMYCFVQTKDLLTIKFLLDLQACNFSSSPQLTLLENLLAMYIIGFVLVHVVKQHICKLIRFCQMPLLPQYLLPQFHQVRDQLSQSVGVKSHSFIHCVKHTL